MYLITHIMSATQFVINQENNRTAKRQVTKPPPDVRQREGNDLNHRGDMKQLCDT